MNNWTNQSSNDASILNDAFSTIDNIFRVLLLATHLFYFVIVLLFREYQKISFINMHHTNVIGLLTGLHYCLWINKETIAFENQTLDNILCNISEASWAILKYARAYSIAVLALFRYLAVFKGQIFNRIANSIKYSLESVVSVWLISGLIYLIAKFSTNAEHGEILCLDGYAETPTRTLIYYLITSILGLVIPILIVNILYYFIQKRLNHLSDRLNRPVKDSNQVNIKKEKEKKLALQFVLLNCLEILSGLFLMILTVSNLVPSLNEKFYFLRQLSRILNNISQLVIPIISILFHHKSLKLRNTIFFKTRSNANNPTRS